MRVEQGYGVCVPRIIGGGVDVRERVRGFRFRAMLGVVKGFVVFDFIGRRLQEESWYFVSATVANGALRQGCILGRASSSIASCSA